MKVTLLALLVIGTLSQLSNVANKPLPLCIKGTSSNFYLDGSANTNYIFRSVSAPDFVQISSDGLVTYNAKNVGAWGIDVRIQDKKTGQTQDRQYNLRVVDRPTQDRIWAYNTDNFYERASAKPFRVLLKNSPSTIKVGSNFQYRFQTQNGKGDLVYAFFGLPKGLSVDRKTGRIFGTLQQAGNYILGCQVADQLGNSAEGFISLTVIDTNTKMTELANVQLQTRVFYKFDLQEIRREQITADRQLFDALAVVNAAKAKLAAKKAAFEQLQSNLALAENQADKASSNAARMKAERQRAAQRLRLVNKAYNDAQDQLNLALLGQAAASDGVINAQDMVSKASTRFTKADVSLKSTQSSVQQAEAALSVARQNLLKAQNNLKNARKQFQRASQDLSDAKDDLQRAIRRKQNSDKDTSKGRDAVQLAQKAFNDAKISLEKALKTLLTAEAQRQKCLQNLSQATYVLQQAKNDLGSANWDLQKALANLYQSKAKKQAADRLSALAIAEGAKYLDGTSPAFKSLGGWQNNTTPAISSTIVKTLKNFGSCSSSNYPKFTGSAKVVSIFQGSAFLSTGQTIAFGDCTSGLKFIKPQAQIVIEGVVNVDRKQIDAYKISEALLLR